MVLALAVAAEAGRLGFGTFGRPGPGFLPFLAGNLPGRSGRRRPDPDRSSKNRAPRPAAVFALRTSSGSALVTAVLFVYVFLWDVIGFLASTFVLLLFLFRCVEPLRWGTVFLASGLTLAFTYILFSVLLGARLPAGRLWTYFIS